MAAQCALDNPSGLQGWSAERLHRVVVQLRHFGFFDHLRDVQEGRLYRAVVAERKGELCRLAFVWRAWWALVMLPPPLTDSSSSDQNQVDSSSCDNAGVLRLW